MSILSGSASGSQECNSGGNPKIGTFDSTKASSNGGGLFCCGVENKKKTTG